MTYRTNKVVFGLVCHLAFLPLLCQATPDRIAVISDAIDGTTCTHANRGAGLRWKHRNGDWLDAAGTRQGPRPLAQTQLKDTDIGDGPDGTQRISFDVSAWFADHKHQPIPARVSFLLRSTGTVSFSSKESPSTAQHPHLRLQFAKGEIRRIAPAADLWTDCSSNNGLGTQEVLTAGKERSVILDFDLSALALPGIPVRATLELTRSARRYGDARIELFQTAVPARSDASPAAGIAAKYPRDHDIGHDPDVYMAVDFETANWKKAFTSIADYGKALTYEIVAADDRQRFVALSGRALRIAIPQGRNIGFDARYEFARTRWASEPDEVYFRYYLRFGDDWYPKDGGKLPGFGGTYRRAGWGERAVDGTNGWSARGSYSLSPSADNPLHAFIPLGSFAAHPDPGGTLGEVWHWHEGMMGLVERNRWYSIEQYVKLNTPGSRDGVLRAWVDGRLAFENTTVRFRDVPSLKVEYIWMNVYHGGTQPAPRDLALYIDNLVIARRYIGPMSQR